MDVANRASQSITRNAITKKYPSTQRSELTATGRMFDAIVKRLSIQWTFAATIEERFTSVRASIDEVSQ
jgi:hypothetical protein